MAIARKNLEDSLVTAPISGVVSLRNAEPGEHMALGRVVLRIVDLETVEAAAFLPALYHPEVVPGKTLFRLGVNGRNAGTNTVAYRSPTINPSLRTFEIKGLVDTASGLAAPGAMADLTLIFETRCHPGVPTSAILVRAGKTIVFVAKDGKARQVEVTTGWQNDEWTEILAGLEPGQPVVTEGQTQLRDGSPVEVL
jgi:RND family efflux transporter MFP subunit